MKIMYIIHSLHNSAGMERILSLKANSLKEKGYSVCIVTTDQKNRKPFYSLDSRIKLIDLNINFEEYYNCSVFDRIIKYFKKNKQFTRSLGNTLIEENPDIVISLMSRSLNVLLDIKSKFNSNYKIIYEQHFNRFYRRYLSSSIIEKIVYQIREHQEYRTIKKIDRLVTLTQEDRNNWRGLSNVNVIPNFVENNNYRSILSNKKVISIGRLEYQKGYDQIVYIWKYIKGIFPDWKLEIWGEGPDKNNLIELVRKSKLDDVIFFRGVTTNSFEKMAESSIYLMTSRFEGFPMVLLEAMSCGLPVVSFNCPCGPIDVIENGVNGFVVEQSDYYKMSVCLQKLMGDLYYRMDIGDRAKERSLDYSKEKVIDMWINLINEIYNEKY